MITGSEAPDAGRIRIGETVKIAYADQSRTLDPGEDRLRGDLRRRGAHHGRRPDDEHPGLLRLVRLRRHGPAEEGAGRSRAGSGTASTWPRPCPRAATSSSSTSRPTTWTSTPCASLEDALAGFAGCAVVVSHDRWFLDRVATHILAFEEDGTIHWIFGNYSEYHEDLRKRKGSAADQPHRLKYRTLKR